MKIKTIRLVAFMTLFCAVSAFAETRSKTELAKLAVSADANVSSEAVRNLRALGRDGLDTLFETYAGEIAKFSATGEASDEWRRIAAALDAVAMQKDAYAAHLYWFTDIEEAKKQADKSNRPILSLRLLGNLNEEFSCANSRFFRALLYSNAEISKYLRENYVLHWKSVRPAPKVTIDFGDGRKIERTLTGNSIHYILDEYGTPIDALPGLYSPSGFLKYLKGGKEVNEAIDRMPDNEKRAVALKYRKLMYDDLKAKRDQSVQTAKVTLTEPKDSTDATEVAPRAATKISTEVIILININGKPTAFNPRIYDNFGRYDPQIGLEDWKKLSKIYAGATKFDDASVAFIRRQNKTTGLTDAEFSGLLANLTQYVALDTTRNDFLFSHEDLRMAQRRPARAGRPRSL